MTMPGYVTLNSEENETETSYSSDLLTYVEQVTRSLSLGIRTDSDWDTYVSELEGMGLNECVAVWQQAYDRTVQ